MKAEAGAAAVDTNSWQFGFDRMYAGLIVGQGADDELLDGILPLQGVAGSAVEALGQFDRLLGELRQARHAFASARPLAAWGEWLLERIDALFFADPRDDAEQNALATLRRPRQPGRGGRRPHTVAMERGARSAARCARGGAGAPGLPARRGDLLRAGAATIHPVPRGLPARHERGRVPAPRQRRRPQQDPQPAAPR